MKNNLEEFLKDLSTSETRRTNSACRKNPRFDFLTEVQLILEPILEDICRNTQYPKILHRRSQP